jgi:GNAT superfamily N-acetyltransferase
VTAGSLRIRSYEPGDKASVWRLHNEALDDLHEIEAVYLEAGGEFLVGVLDGRVVAMGALRRISSGEAEVKRMRVEPALQGRGHGQAILDALHHRAAELGYSRLYLDTTVHQRVARSLYEGNGYHESRRGKIGPFDCVFYERNLVV